MSWLVVAPHPRNSPEKVDNMSVSYVGAPDFLTVPKDKFELAANVGILGVDFPLNFKLSFLDQRRVFGFAVVGKQNIRLKSTGIVVWVTKCFGHDFDEEFYTFEELFRLVADKKVICV